MGSTIGKPLPRLPVPAGKKRICVSGFRISHHTGRAREIADLIARTHPDQYETWYYFDNKGFRPGFLEEAKAGLPADQQAAFRDHATSPFCWLEHDDGTKAGIGGRDRLCEWALDAFRGDGDAPLRELCAAPPPITKAFFDATTPGTAATE